MTDLLHVLLLLNNQVVVSQTDLSVAGRPGVGVGEGAESLVKAGR
jgi:hypothetical protein